MEKRKHIVILAAGDFPSHPIPLAALHDADFVVCCDSAWKSIQNSEFRIQNYIVIGDGDSLPPSTRRQLGEKFIHVAEQDYNDLHKAMRWATQEFSILNSQFSILGATGKREDHTLGNIAYLVTFAEEYPGIQLEMLTDHGRLLSFRGERTFPSFPGQQVSLFVMDPATALTSTGLRWPLDAFHPSRWWQATLNEALSDTFTLHATGWTVAFLSHSPKE